MVLSVKAVFYPYRLYSFILLCFLSIPASFAQQVYTTETGAIHRMYSPEDGIPSHSPTNAIVSADGYLWLSTSGGTVRISGNEIEDFGSEYGINMMQNIYYDRNRSVMWFSDSRTLASFDGQHIKIYGPEEGFDPPGLGRKEVVPVLADSKGRLWVGSYTPPFDSPQNGGLMALENGEFRTFSFDELPLHNITGAFEASDGSIWFTSTGYQADGILQNHSYIARYIHNEFVIYDNETGCMNVANHFRDPDGFSISITEDKSGNLWFQCNGVYNTEENRREFNGLFMFDGNSFEPVEWLNEIMESRPGGLFILYDNDQDELIVTLSPQGGYNEDSFSQHMFIFSNEEWRTEQIVSWQELKELSDGFLSANAVYFGIYVMRSVSGRIIANMQVAEPGTNELYSIVFQKIDGTWEWLDNARGFFLINLSGDVYLTAQNDPDVIGIYTPPYSRLLTKEDGLLKLPVESTTGGVYYRQRFFTDRDGNVWINYLNNYDPETETYDALGTTVWDGGQFINFSVADGFSSNNLLFVNQSSDGALWFPSDNGVNRFIWNGDTPQITILMDQDGSPFFSRMVVERANGEIFTYNNYVAPATDTNAEQPFFLGRLEGDSFNRFDPPFADSLMALPYQEFELIADRENRMWITGRFSPSAGDALFLAQTHIRVMDDDTWNIPTDEWNVPENRLFYVGELHNGHYFLKEGGFTKFDFEKQRFIDLSDSTNATADFRILQRVNTAGMFFNIETDDHLYIRFRDTGLAVFDGTNLTYLDRRNGLPSLRISYPKRDRNGDMLFTIPTGGIIFSGTDFTAIRDDAASGAAARGIARDKNNNILIAHNDLGITITQMDTIRNPVRISTILADGERYYEGQTPRLSYGQNNLHFRFVTLNFSKPEDVRFSYILDGYGTEWSRPSESNFIEFRSLSPGTYTFRVRSVGPGTLVSEPTEFSFSIAPPWWRSWWAYSFYFVMLIFGFIATYRWQRRRLIQKAREKARERELAHAREIEKAYRDLETAHENLKSAQNQLVQQEKLASLGQLTAGIAHEIKNPLNFVNNFSDLSVELIDEIREEINSVGAIHELPLQNVSEILDDIEANLRKIHEHGSRADGIVKSMLLHSRGGSGEMESTDLNALIKEYVNLAFHGMRAGKDPINVDIQTELDESIGQVPLIAEDFSRVILNLCNNAFDAMREKAKMNSISNDPVGAIHELPLRDQGYQPKLTVRTKSENGTISIEVQDNGPGIPDEIKDKILQPFFTTKKGTQGTGLGLSITHDIVKAHGGSMKIESEIDKGTTFMIELPVV